MDGGSHVVVVDSHVVAGIQVVDTGSGEDKRGMRSGQVPRDLVDSPLMNGIANDRDAQVAWCLLCEILQEVCH